jgi:hypothetical protein
MEKLKAFWQKLTSPKTMNVNTQFTFAMVELPAVAEKYEYKVKATNKEQAFEKLVRYFYDKTGLDKDVVSNHLSSSDINQVVFYTEGMPEWFGRCVSSQRCQPKDIKKLREYCALKGIKLRT